MFEYKDEYTSRLTFCFDFTDVQVQCADVVHAASGTVERVVGYVKYLLYMLVVLVV